VRRKWLGVFADSPLEPHRTALERLEDVAGAAQRALNPLPRATAEEAVKDIEAVLLAMRKPGLAAKVSELAAPAPAREPEPPRPQPPPPPRPQPPPPPSAAAPKMPVALDGSNIAWRHGVSRRFSIRGVAEALAYYAGRGHPCVVFLPEGRLRDPPRAQPDGGAPPDGEAEAYYALKRLEGSATLVLTPEKDYDDCYLTHFAREYMAVVVSNDRFEDQVYQAQAEGPAAADEWRRWITACRVPFTFHGHTFVPNPTFSMARAAAVARDLCRPAEPAA
jgi:hypothetical protein